ncbi:lipopolysaccharide biosynthesis protein-like protein [Burkholderia metallica]|nr:lipopolysaccharide biosynthesis protein-like protein [Burkholderia metallica]
MHRSGSSAITNMLPVLGVQLGDALLPGIEGNNAKGFFEDSDLNALNIAMLDAVENDWHHLTSLEEIDFDTLRHKGFFGQAVDLLQKKIRDADVFGFKDPRVSKLLPFWQQVFAHCQVETHYLITLRNPVSVARSLKERNGFIPGKSYLLWLQHVLPGLVHTNGASRCIVDYDAFLEAPQPYIDLCATRFGLKIDPQRLAAYETEFLDLSLRHTVFSSTDFDLEPMCQTMVRDAYTALRACALQKHDLDDPELRQRCIEWSDALAGMQPTLRLIDALSAQVDLYYQTAMQHGGEFVRQRDQCRTLEEKILELERQSKADAHTATLRIDALSQALQLSEAAVSRVTAEHAASELTWNQEALVRETTHNQLVRTLEAESFRERESLIAAIKTAQQNLSSLVAEKHGSAEADARRELQWQQTLNEQRDGHRQQLTSLQERSEAALSAALLKTQTLTDQLDELQAALRGSDDKRIAREAQFHDEVKALQADIEAARRELQTRDRQHQAEATEYKAQWSATETRVHMLERDLQATRDELERIKASASWKLTSTLRRIGRWIIPAR